MLLWLAALMESGNCGKVIANTDSVATLWRHYKTFPVKSNIQLVFYRKPGPGDILVKALLKEHEVSLPVHTNTAIPIYQHIQKILQKVLIELTGKILFLFCMKNGSKL